MATDPPTLDALAKYPKMAAWFNPVLLVRLLWRVILSDVFGQYADRRLIVAALDTATPEELFARARKFMLDQNNTEIWTFTPDQEGAVWIDFVADLGDGFDATYAMASLLAQEKLEVGGHVLPRGRLLVMGGDQVYPRAAPETYRKQLRDPYDWAFPDPYPRSQKGPPVYAIPGNHDWYDGLVLFLALFAREQHMHLGGWRTHQRRSYFALQITKDWWLWAMDAQLDDDVDQPQRDYFVAIAKRMDENSKIILCGPEPGWLYTHKQGSKSLSVIDFIGWMALNAHRGLSVPLVLSGDTHHYSRYEGDDHLTQFITSGGGGAFLHSTHQVEPTIDLDRRSEGFSWLDGKVKKLTLGRDSATGNEAVYPSKADSIRMLAGNFAFVGLNPGFAFVLGTIYWLLSLLAARWPIDMLYVAPALLVGGFFLYTKNQEGGGWKIFGVSAINGLVHALALFTVIHGVQWLLGEWFASTPWVRLSFFLHAAAMIVLGGVVAGFLFGVYLYVTSRWLHINHNDAFSSMRRDSHRNLLRLRIKDDTVTVYPVGLDRSPARHEWRRNSEIDPLAPKYVPATPLAPHLIEAPVTIRAGLPPASSTAHA
jgi:hypothetical protein